MVKTYGSTIYRDGPDGEKIPFKISAKTLIIYKEYTGKDLINDLVGTCNVDLKEYYTLSQKEADKKIKEIDKNINSDKVFNVMRNLILCARLAAYPTEAEMQEAMALGEEILPLEMLISDIELGTELMNLVLGDIKKKIK